MWCGLDDVLVGAAGLEEYDEVVGGRRRDTRAVVDVGDAAENERGRGSGAVGFSA